MTITRRDRIFLFLCALAFIVMFPVAILAPKQTADIWYNYAVTKPSDGQEITAQYSNGDEVEAVAAWSAPDHAVMVYEKGDGGVPLYRGDPVRWKSVRR